MNIIANQQTVFLHANKTVGIPYKVLQTLLNTKASGRLTIDDPLDETVQWRVYLGDGKIHFASSTMGHKERLTYFLKRCFPGQKFSLAEEITNDYHYLCKMWNAGQISSQEVRQIFAKITQEALIQALALPRASLQFEKTTGLDNLLLALPLKSLISPVRNQVRHWLQVRSEIRSPFQRPLIEDEEKITNLKWIQPKEYELIQQFGEYFNQHLCLYEIAAKIGKHTLELALGLHPLINTGGIKMLPYQETQSDTRPLVACIDDSQGIQKIVKLTLEASGLQVISVLEPATALTTFVRKKPQVILMDINMPEIDGYKLSYMFRQSTILQDIPIIMLTGRDGVLDRVKAKMVGAVGYVSKPFNPQELVNIVHSHLPAGKKK
ncbi:MAG: response regulator [Gomphosphaeria aponina SAG 52.96 = DSM 107014]|uniref:Protein PatA n=1 Tax=Gomphosphaeria aponina SAG 52.96 = DSM 107014 TaxID=1521640 RepID=A0A941JPZ9_9CHRO|nr:response regulator [Gomphosphaeria aponina SAG 52.96 = DSM 107014]